MTTGTYFHPFSPSRAETIKEGFKLRIKLNVVDKKISIIGDIKCTNPDIWMNARMPNIWTTVVKHPSIINTMNVT